MTYVLIYTLTQLLLGMLVLWIACRYMIEKRNMAAYLPFYFIGGGLLFSAGMMFCQAYFHAPWLALEAVYVLMMVWITKVVREVKYAG